MEPHNYVCEIVLYMYYTIYTDVLLYVLSFSNPRRTCAAWVTVVGVSVCVSTGTTGNEAGPISDNNGFRTTRAKKPGDFPETTVFERYAVKTSEKANNA